MDKEAIPLLTILKWTGTVCGVLGALLLALNISNSGWGWVLFFFSSTSWGIAGLKMKEPSLWILHAVFTVVNLLGIYRWLI